MSGTSRPGTPSFIRFGLVSEEPGQRPQACSAVLVELLAPFQVGVPTFAAQVPNVRSRAPRQCADHRL